MSRKSKDPAMTKQNNETVKNCTREREQNQDQEYERISRSEEGRKNSATEYT